MTTTRSTNATPLGESAANDLSARKQILFSFVIVVGFFLAFELVARVGAYFLYNRSPYFLFYGFSSWMADAGEEGHTIARSGYFKFPPNRVLHQYGMFNEPTPIRINSLGFRGSDFSPAKAAGTTRIICLGESSTFGFFDRDSFTYPALLQRVFPDHRGDDSARVEVINAGIPQANSDNIRAMLKGEILGYDPDVITVYAAYNDVTPMDQNTVQRVLNWLHGHFAAYVALKHVVSALGGPELHSRWASFVPAASAEYVHRQIALHERRYEDNLRAIYQLTTSHRAQLVFIRQPVNYSHDLADRGKSYQEKVNEANKVLATTGKLSAEQTSFLIHAALIGVLDRLAREYAVPEVDNIAILDAHPEYFASKVHLTEDGNEALAEAIFRTVAPLISEKVRPIANAYPR